MSLEEFSQRVAQDEIKHSQTQSPLDSYHSQKSRAAYAKRYFYDYNSYTSIFTTIRLLEGLPKDVDLDSYCMTVYPSELLTLFNESAPVSLISRKPFIRDVEEYRDWVYIGQSVAMLLIPPRFKEPLLRELESLNYTIDFAQYDYVLIKGNQVTLMGVLVHCLTVIDCDAVRIQVYNLKAPIRLLPRFYNFYSSHPLRYTNFFDVGATEKQNIAGLSLLKGVGPLTKTFPICSPAAKGYGTVRLQTSISHKFVDTLALENQMVETKMYSKVAHVIRSIGVKPPLFKANNIRSLKSRYHSAKKAFDQISNKPDKAIQGFRVEATIRATNLIWALEIVLIYNLLDSGSYDQRYELTELPRSAYIANAQRLINKVQDYNLLKGSNNTKVSNERSKVEADVWQSVGWNSSRRKLTRHNDVNAWWNDQITSQGFEKSIRFVSHVFFSDTDNCRTFFRFVKSKLKCPKCGALDSYRSIGGVDSFSIRCRKRNCLNRMGKKKCTALWDELLLGEDNEYFQDAIDTTKEANCSPRLTPSIQNNSTDSNNSPCLSDSPEPPWETFIPQKYFHESSVSSICPSLYDTPEPRKRFIAEISSDSSSHSTGPSYDSSSTSNGSSDSTCSSPYDSPEPPQKKLIVELSSDSSSGLASPPLFHSPEPPRKGSVIVISSESSEGIPEPHPLWMFQDDGFSRWPVPEDNGLYNAESHRCVESERRVATPTNLPVQATSTEQVHHDMADRPKYTLHTLWKNILDSNFPESVDIYQITDHYIRTEDYIVGDGNCMFRAISFALHGDQEKHGDVRKLVVKYMVDNIDERVGQEKVKLLCDLNWRDYLGEMQKEGTWGDEYVLINAALACCTNIAVLSTGGSRKYIKTFTFSGEPLIAICHDGNHYEVLKGIR